MPGHCAVLKIKMRVVIQRVLKASVTVEGEVIGKINKGLLLFLAIHKNDTRALIPKLADKITKLRIFEDEAGKINHCITDVKGEILVVSQFTLYGDCQKGNRPSFIEAALPEKAEEYYQAFIQELQKSDLTVASGKFRTYMEVELINDGPTTLILDL